MGADKLALLDRVADWKRRTPTCTNAVIDGYI